MLAEGGYGLLSLAEVDPSQVAAFACGKAHLDLFLSTTARAWHAQRLGLTSVAFHNDHTGPVGYFTLSNDAIPLQTSESFDLGIEQEVRLSSFPAVKIGRMAVLSQLQGEGVGSALMKLIVGEVLDSDYLSSARLLVVDADNDPNVIRFYEKNGFVNSLWAANQSKNHKGPSQTVKMIRDILGTLG